jgi:hypothetical protein
MKFALLSSLAASTPQASSALARPDLLPSFPVYKEEVFPPVSTRKGAVGKKIWYGPLALKPAEVSLPKV